MSFTISSNTNWSWTDNATWLNSNESTTQTGTQTFTYSVASNTSAQTRTGTIYITTGNITRTHTVTQSAPEVDIIDPVEVIADALGDELSFTVNVADGVARTVESAVDWLTITGGASGTGNGTVTYTVNRNSSAVEREAQIKVAIIGGEEEKPLDEGLVAHYPFNGNANDESGNGNNGTVNGATLADDHFGKSNSAYYFDGNDSISVRDNASLNFGAGDMTVALWFKFNGGIRNTQLVGQSTGGNRPKWFIYYSPETKNFQLHINDTAAGSNYWLAKVAYEDDDEWHHLAYVKRGDNYSSYLDGLLGTTEKGSRFLPNSTSNFNIGRAEGDPMKGHLDDVRIYNRGLSGDEISGLYSTILIHTVTQTTIGLDADTDNDGVLDIHETDTGTFVSATDTGSNPRLPDSDGDGFSDGQEITARSDPNNVNSIPEEEITINPATQSIGADGGDLSFAVSSNTNWSWTDNTSWLTSGEETLQSGNQTFTYSVDSNTTTQVRSATIFITDGNITRTHTVIQSAPRDDISGDDILDPVEVTADALGEELFFTVNVADGIVRTVESVADWLTITGGASITGNGTVTYTVRRNVSQEQRENNIKIAIAAREEASLMDGLVAHYPFNGNANDESGNGNNGTVNGATLADDHLGNVNSAYYFDGNDSISVRDNASLDFGAGDMTVALWFKFTGDSSRKQLVGQSTPGKQPKWFIYYIPDEKSFLLHINDTAAGSNHWLAKVAYEDDGEWHHLAYVKRGNEYSSYLDGLLGATETGPRVLPNSSSYFRMGKAEGDPIKGHLDDIRIYNRGLSGEEISVLYSTILIHTVTQPAIDPDADSDNDGVLDIHETDTGTFVSATDTGSNPRSPDSDGDGFSDRQEIAARFDPNDANSRPEENTSSSFNLSINTTLLPSQPLNDGLVAHYPFNGNAHDESGNGNNGTVNGATLAEDHLGNANSAYYFDGNDSIWVRDNASLDFGAGDMTVALWFKFTGDINRKQLVGQSVGFNNPKWFIYYIPDQKSFLLHINDTGAGSNYWLARTTYEDDGEWHHLAYVKRGNEYSSYLDGLLGATETGPRVLPNSTSNFNMGKAEGDPIKGHLDDIRIYNRGLSVEEISGLYNLDREINIGIVLSFPTKIGKAYRIEESADLKTWRTKELGINGTGDTVQRSFPINGVAWFLRVSEE